VKSIVYLAVFLASIMLTLDARAQADSGLQALLQALHQHDYAGGVYEGFATATPQEMIERIDRSTLQNLAAASQDLQGNPNDVNALVRRGSAALAAADKSMYRDSWLHFGAQDLESALRLDPNNFYARHNYAQTCFESGDPTPDHRVMRLAVYHFTKAIALKPDSARSYMGRGWAYLMLQDDSHANADFQKALQLDPSLRPQLEAEASDIHKRLSQMAGAQQMLRDVNRQGSASPQPGTPGCYRSLAPSCADDPTSAAYANNHR
jgi:tetratricopeptide (TPR) repeat protein